MVLDTLSSLFVGSSQRSDEVHLYYTGSNDNLLCLPTITSDTSMERSVTKENTFNKGQRL